MNISYFLTNLTVKTFAGKLLYFCGDSNLRHMSIHLENNSNKFDTIK